MTRKNIWLEGIGTLFMIGTGSALHFVFDWSGAWHPLALIAAVNESIWEHLKLAFWPGVIWAVVAPYPDRAKALAGKGVGLAVTSALIVAIFQSYTAVLGRNLLALDIGTFVVAIVLGQFISCRIILRDNKQMRRFGLVLLCAQLAAFSLGTYRAPDHWLFVDSRNGLTGMQAHSVGRMPHN